MILCISSLSLVIRKVPMFGLEAIFRNGVPVGHLRRADYGFFIDKTIGYGYIRNPDGGVVRAFKNTHAYCSVPFLSRFPVFVFQIWTCESVSSEVTDTQHALSLSVNELET